MKKKIFVKSMSVFLAVLMILSVWTFVPGVYNMASCADECPHTTTEILYEEHILDGTCTLASVIADIERCTECHKTIRTFNQKLGKPDPNNHVNLIKVPAKADTCEEIGWAAYEYCLSCDYTTYKEINDITGHDYKTETTPATCSQAGKIVYTCKNDSSHTYTVDIPVTPHTDVSPEDGLCDMCGMNVCLHEESVLLNVQASSCVSEGYTGGKYCSVCGLLVEAGKILPILNHSFSEIPAEIKKATCHSDRVDTYKCKNCPEIKSVVYKNSHKQVPHTTVTVSVIEPSCDKNGYYAHFCTECSTNVEVDTYAPTGHVDENLDGKCDIFGCGGKVALPGGQQPPCDCMCHDESSIVQFFFKIVTFFCKLIKVGKECECGVLHY